LPKSLYCPAAGAAGRHSGETATATDHHAGRYRWGICALLFAATTVNYVDRQVLGVLAPELGRTYGWSETEYSHIVTAFQAAYAIGLLCAGAIIDRLGTRVGYALAIAVWSLAAMSHALVRSVTGFMGARFVLGLGESGNFPAAVKTVAEWFPQRERALATGIFNAGSNVGAILAPLIVTLAAARFGLRAGFLATSALSFAWLIAWLAIYRSPPKPALSDLSSAPANSHFRWRELLRHRQTWAIVLARLLTDPIWWFFLFWLPKFLDAQYGLSLTALGPPLVAIYLMADGGSIGGGWLAGSLLRRGWTADRARKTAMLVCAVVVVPIVFAAHAQGLWLAVALIGLAVAGHQGWSANLYTLVSDLFPSEAVASVVGLASCAGAIGGMLISTLVGWLLQSSGSYVPVFTLAASAYLAALALVQVLVPQLQPASLAAPQSR